jgi:hypothetical protein
MTYYTVIYYCGDEEVTCYQTTIFATGGNDVEAAAVVFGQIPPELPRNVAGVFVNRTYAH